MSASYRDEAPRLLLILISLAGLCFFAENSFAVEPKPAELVMPLGHTDQIDSVALSVDGKHVLSGSGDKTAILWDVETAKPVQMFAGHKYGVNSVAIDGDGRRVLTGSLDGMILWDTRTGQKIKSVKGHKGWVDSLALSEDGKFALSGSGSENTAFLWDLEKAEPIQRFGLNSSISSVAMSADCKRVLTGCSWYAVLWDSDGAKVLQTLKGHHDYVISVAISRNGSRLLTGSLDHTAILWDANTGKAIQKFNSGNRSKVRSVAISDDGRHVLTGEEWAVILWDAVTAKRLKTLDGLSNSIKSVALSRDGRRAVAGGSTRTGGSGYAAILWDAETAKPIQVFKGHADPIYSLALSDDGKRVLARSKLWELDKAEYPRSFGDPSNPQSLSGDRKRVITTLEREAILWDADSGRALRSFKGHTRELNSVALSRDGRRVLTQSFDSTAILWDADTGRLLRTFELGGGTKTALSSDGQYVLGTGDHRMTAILWDASDGKPLQRFKVPSKESSLKSLALNERCNRVLGYSDSQPDSHVFLWDVETAKSIQTFELFSIAFVESVALSDDGKRVLATNSHDSTVTLWDADTGQSLQAFRHDRRASKVTIAHDNSFVVTGSEDGAVRIWRPGYEDPLFSFMSVGEDWIFWTPAGYYSCSPNGENLIAWKIPDDSRQGYRIVAPVNLHQKFYRPDLFRYLLKELDLDRALGQAEKDRGGPIEIPTTIAKALPPVVLIIDPKRDVEIDLEKLTLDAVAVSVGEHAVTRMRLLVNGRNYDGNLSNFEVPNPSLRPVKRTWHVELEPGEYQVQVIAESDVSFGKSDILRVRRKAIVETLPRLFVLAVGVSAYEKASYRSGVAFAATDAGKFANAVEKSSGPLYREVKVVRLIDQDATRKNILQALVELRKQVTMHDTVMIFFAGHGERDDQNTFYFLPVETEDVITTALSEGDFKGRVKALPGKVILLLDACHSGTLIENPGRDTGGLTDKLYRELTSNEHGLVMMCSSMGLEKSLESPPHKSGMFAIALVEGLEGKARMSSEGAVYLSALEQYVADRVKELSKGEQHPLMSYPTITDIPLTKP